MLYPKMSLPTLHNPCSPARKSVTHSSLPMFIKRDFKSYLDVDWEELISNTTTKSVFPRDYTMILTVPETDYEIIGAFATASIPEHILN